MKIYILEKYSPEDDMVIMNVFSTREGAKEWLDASIREEYNIEDDFVGDLEDEVSMVEYFINAYEVL